MSTTSSNAAASNGSAGESATAVLDNWEEMNDTDLNSKLHVLKQQQQALPSASGKSPASAAPRILQRPNSNGTGPNASPANGGHALLPTPVQLPLQLLHKDDDYGGHQRRSGGSAGPEPIMKILRRPEHERSGPATNERPRQPIKTLQQREQEYAQARLRILGEAKPTEGQTDAAADAADIASNGNGLPAATAAINNGTGQQQQQQHHHLHGNHHHHHHHNGGAFATTSTAPSIPRRPPLLGLAPPSHLNAAGVLRQPRGPDEAAGAGFAGFRR